MSRRLSIIGMVLTFAYLFLLLFVFNGRFTEILLLKPNEIGDLLAGMFGPLAILWLILGFFQQGIELRQNTAALKLQADELRMLVDAENAQKDLMREAQSPFFQVEIVYWGGTEVTFRIKNVGASVSNLVITGSSGFGNFQDRKCLALGRDEVVKCQTNLAKPMEFRLEEPSGIPYWIAIRYQCANGTIDERTFDHDDEPHTKYGKFVARNFIGNQDRK